MKTAEEVHGKFMMPIIYKKVLCERLWNNHHRSLSKILKDHAVIKSFDNKVIEIIIYNPFHTTIEILNKATNKVGLKAELFNIFKKDLEIYFIYNTCKIDKMESDDDENN